MIVLAVKPQAMKAVCESLRPSLQPHQLVVSIAAGITCASMTNWLGAQPIVRCMPNTPALLRQGVSGLYATGEVTEQQRDQAQELLSAVGIAVWLEQEQQLDAVTAVSGSGPAYFFLLIEAMTAAGVKLGLPTTWPSNWRNKPPLALRRWPSAARWMPPNCAVASPRQVAPHKRLSSRSRPEALKPWWKQHWVPPHIVQPRWLSNWANSRPLPR